MSIKSIASACCPFFLRPLWDRIENSPIGYRLTKGVFWSIAGTVISRSLMLVASILVARMLGKDIFGEYGIIRNTVAMLGIFAGFGLGLTATKYVAEFRQSDPERAGRIIGLSWLVAMATGGLMAVGLFIFAPWLAEHTLNAPHLAGVLRIGALILFINAINGAQTGVLSGFEAFKTIACVNLFTGLISFPVLVCGAYFGGLTGAVWALTINLGINWLLNHVALRKEARRYSVHLTFKKCSREWPVLWKFSLPAFLAGTVAQPVYWACITLLANQPNGYGEVAIFSAAEQWYAILLFLPMILGQVVLPVVSDQLGQNKAKQSVKTVIFALKISLLITVPLVSIGCIASPYIMSLYGAEFTSGWPTMVVLLLSVVVKAAIAPAGILVTSTGRMWIGFWTNSFWAVTIITATLLLVDYGSLGLVSARLISFVLSAICNYFVVIWIIRNLRETE